MTHRLRWLSLGTLAIALCLQITLAPAGASESIRTYTWPVHGPVIGAYDPPTDPYGSGHRGIDIAAVPGTPVVAAHDGVVAFAGKIGSGLYVSIDHPDGIRTTYSWMGSISVARGRAVEAGDLIGTSGQGHPNSLAPHLHLGARIGDTYIDPLSLLEPPDLSGWVRLVPVAPARA